MLSKTDDRPKPLDEIYLIWDRFGNILQPVQNPNCIEGIMRHYASRSPKAERYLHEDGVADLRAKADKADKAVAVLRLVDDYFDQNMKLETSEEFQRLRHKVTKGIGDAETN